MSLNKIKINNTTTVNTGVVYDITKATSQSYDTLSAALGTDGNNVPPEVREGGMSVRFVHMGDNMYVQYRLMVQNFTTDTTQWQGVDDVPTAGSENLVKSGGVEKTTGVFNEHFRKSTNVCSGTIEYESKIINSSGELVDNEIYNTSEMFPIKGGVTYIRKSITFLAYYDVDKHFISRPSDTTLEPHTTPANAVYARASSTLNVSLWQLNEGSTLLEYEKPDALISNNLVVDTDETFTKKNIAADAYAVGISKNVISLKVIAAGGILGQLNIGEYGFNSSINKIIYKIGTKSVENIDYINLDPIINGRYLYNGDIYKWDGTSMQIEESAVIISASAGSGAAILSLLNINQYGLVISASQNYTLVRKRSESAYEHLDFDENSTLYAWNNSIYRWDGSALVNIFSPLYEDVESINLNLYGRILTTVPETITLKQGDVYEFTNNGSVPVNLYARLTPSGSNITIFENLSVGASITYLATLTTYYVIVGSGGDRNVFVKRKEENNLNMGLFTVFTTTPNYVLMIKGHTYKFVNKGATCNLILKNDDSIVWQHLLMYPFEEDTVNLDTNVNTVVVGSGGQRLIEVYDMESLGGIFSKNNQGMNFDVPVEFDFTEEIEDVSQDFNTFDFSNTIYLEDILEQVYSHMDKLCALYPEYIKKYDPMTSSDINQSITIDGTDYQIVIHGLSAVKDDMIVKGFSDYPEYAKGIISPVTKTLSKGDGTTYEVTYDITPEYKTYVYILKSEDDYLVGNYSKRKIMLTGGVHANERISPVNLCILAKKLCESADENAFKLRVACDYLIIPFVNGYGCYHTRRTNANWVDINRNYPTKIWTFLTNGLDERDRWKCIYSGPYAGSEFETNLVASVLDYYKPDFGIDHHNYSVSESQFYVEYGGDFRPVIMKAAIDTFKALQKKYSSNFGNDYKLFIGNESIRLTRNATTDMFMRENIPNNAAITIEVSECVNYENGGIRTTNPTERFNEKVANIAYYTLKHQLMIYIQHFYKKYGMVKQIT